MVLINASNLHSGGAVQVATSFLYEISNLADKDFSLFHVFVSSEVADELSRLNTNTTVFGHYEVINVFGLNSIFSSLNKIIKNYDLVFTVFGPNYFSVKADIEIVGFAQSWILNFNNPISERMSFLSRNILRTKFFLQWLFFLRADHYIVELEHVKNGLIEDKGIDPSKISVVHNTFSSLYENKKKWSQIYIEKNIEKIALGIVARDYPHKNINILPVVAEILESKYNLKIHFYVTLNEAEWATKDTFFRKYVSTVGSLSSDQCPSFYQQMDGVVFPSLLECFSATPLEAMVMGKPLFASDRSFVRDVCADYAVYFNPLEPCDIALKIATYFKKNGNKRIYLQQARDYALQFSTAKGRAIEYLEIIQQHMKG